MQECTCGNASNLCFQWTLTINELNFSKSDFSYCGRGSPDNHTPAESCIIPQALVIPHSRVYTTIAKIYILGRSWLLHEQCIVGTVQCALRAAYKDISLFSSTSV